MDQPEYMTTPQAAAYLQLSPNTLSRWRWSGDGPRYRKLGRSVRYARTDLEEFAARGARDHSTQPSAAT